MKKTRRAFLAAAGGSLLGAVPLVGRAVRSENASQPASTPSSSRQWAMVVDLRKCMAKGDCLACQEACHVAHNVPKIGQAEEAIKWIWKEPYCGVFADLCHAQMRPELRDASVPVLCNHCQNPPCVKVCPTKATWKRPVDGIVMMDMHRCIGCRYCMAACPYGARSFNFSDPRPHIPSIRTDYPTRMKGVVEKCNFCAERLARNGTPACVEAAVQVGCRALVFGDLADANGEVVKRLTTNNAIRRRPELGTGPRVYYIV